MSSSPDRIGTAGDSPLARRVRRPPAIAIVAAVVWALAAWVSVGVMAMIGDAASPRIGLLPAWWVPAAAGTALLALACWKRIPERAWWPALIPSVLLLPWLPFSVPSAFLLWTGPVVWLVWGGTAVALALGSGLGAHASGLASALGQPRRAARVALVASLAVYAVAAWTSSAIRPIGDEPQYLIITQSLLLDGDLQIENNHRREDYVAYYTADLKPDYLRRGRNGQIYSIHAPGLAALVAPAFAVGGYPAVVVFLALVSAIGAWLVWRTSFALTGRAGAAWFGWAAVCLSVPYLCHSGAVFPDGPSAVLVMTGVAALVRLERANPEAGAARPGLAVWLLHGLALAALPWLHTRAAAAAGVLGACIALRLVQRRAWAPLASFSAVPVASALGWFSFFYLVYGRFDPSAPYGSYSQSNLANLWPGLPALLLDQQYGLFPNAPVYVVALAGLGLLFRSSRRLAVEIGVLLLVYLAAVASYRMWWGGWSAPARFAVPVLLALGPCAAVFWERRHARGRAVGLVALGLSLGASAVLATVDGGRLMLNSRDGVARWLEWLCPVVDLPRALPSFFWRGPWQAVGDAAVWAAVLLVVWLGFRLAARALTAPAALATATPLLFAVGVIAAATIVWEARGAAAHTPTSGQLRLMDAFDPAVLPLGVQYRPLRIRSSAELVGRLRVSTSERRPRAANAPPLWVRDLPAGTYRVLRTPSRDRPDGFSLSLSKSPFPLQHCSFEAMASAECLVRLPADVVELRVDAEGGPRAAPSPPRALAVQPIDLLAPRERPSRLKAIAAAAYGTFSAFAFDQRVFLEPAGLWVEGGFEVPLVVASAEPRASMPVRLRNGARPNRIRIDGALTLDLPFAEREERIVIVPLDARSRAAFLRIRTDHGFRPSETEPGSRDQRYLGVWLDIPR